MVLHHLTDGIDDLILGLTLICAVQDLWVYVSEESVFTNFGNDEALKWHETNIPYAVWTPDSVRQTNFTYLPSESVQHNGTLYAHVFFARSGFSPDPESPEYERSATFSKRHLFIVYLPKPKVDNRKSLLSKDEKGNFTKPLLEAPEEEVDEGPSEWVSFFKPNVTMNLVDDFTRYPRGGVPPQIVDHMTFDELTGDYYPTIFFNEFWLLRDKLIILNETIKEVAVNMDLGPISLTRWQLYQQIDQSFQLHKSYGSMMDGEADELKRVFLEGNPYLLGLTMCVSLLHTVFDFLAFKNDIQFWNKNKSMEGLSARSVVINFICQLIVFLYLLDNETSWMIILSAGMGCCIEFWKIGKAMHVEVDRSRGYPVLKFTDRQSYAGNKTKEYDDLAMKYLSYVLYPLVAGFAIYSLMYERHKSWYSWILGSLTSCVYTFGFIMMCPQLFINYKLQSVAHMPWRQMTYKFLNTIIDDLFAFVIKMPLLHRLSVFRDDIVFLVYLYQRWKYPVDKKRINEFGFGGDDKDEEGEISTQEGAAQEDRVRENRADGPRACITEDSMSKTAAGIRSAKDNTNCMVAVVSGSTKENKKIS
ncbi:hypothetical protein KC19_VG011000 [Ceratodon purpureus]|uniref:Cleft lip and palate associated transmembrane protein n=1 Tax=Ceratodon purpureus TaxID=3225 RepID=A0A8T0HKX9_CERPU|nr:hypothetical protein KC19_VG011000 [Ceratodon purpureus]